MRSLTLSDFAALVGETFSLRLGESTIAMTLTEANPIGGCSPAGLARAAFELIFRSSSVVVLPQQIYTFSNPIIGEQGIFISPFARDASGIVYQAVFN